MLVINIDILPNLFTISHTKFYQNWMTSVKDRMKNILVIFPTYSEEAATSVFHSSSVSFPLCGFQVRVCDAILSLGLPRMLPIPSRASLSEFLFHWHLTKLFKTDGFRPLNEVMIYHKAKKNRKKISNLEASLPKTCLAQFSQTAIRFLI